jgi:hypothetical protein
MKKFLPSLLPGLLFALIAPLLFYTFNPENRIYIPWQETLRLTLICVVFFGVYYGLAWLASRQVDAAGAIAVLLVLGSFHLWQVSLLVVLAAGLFVLMLRLVRRRIQYSWVNTMLICLGLVLAGWSVAQLTAFFRTIPTPEPDALIQPIAASAAPQSAPQTSPDIYYIILDGYGRADMLQSVYGYDNTPFLQALRDLGFVVADDGRSNYAQTVLSLGSSLNMQYLEVMSETMGDSPAWWPVRDVLQHSQVRQFLEERGYRTVFTGSLFDFTDIHDGDEYWNPFAVQLNNFESGFVRFTSLSALQGLDRFVAYPSYATHRRMIQANFSALSQIAASPGPKFVFAHIIAPHPPFVFDADGNPVDPDYPFTMVDKMRVILDEATYKQSYIAELQYVNAQVLAMLRAILEDSSAAPVILIQGDHGPGLYLDSESAADSCLYERYSIFSAYYLPGPGSERVPGTISPVNSFRMVFNRYFASGLPLLPDRNYFSPSSRFYTFEDVTDEIGTTCATNPIP